jgi:pimeloyl-ACP methyl ester carboxylesterase/DNA-binding winged helix-turn-helix (wHTH) protein
MLGRRCLSDHTQQTNCMALADGPIYRFGDFELDTRLHELRCDGVQRHVEPQVFDVLSYLFACRDRLVTKEELLEKVWGHRYVAPTTLNSRIKHARQAVGDDGDAQRVIRTVHGLGFRVVTDVEVRGSTAPTSPATLEQRIQFCTAPDGVRLAYATSGSGPPLVKPANWLTHVEYDWESPVWRHWLRALSREHTLVRFDERGNGLSDREVEDVSFEAWVRDLETVVDAVGLERFPLLGISQGCAVAIAYAVRHPERVTKLVLYGGFAEGVITRSHTQQQLDETTMVMRGIPLGWGHDNPAFRMFFAARFLPEGTPEQMRWFSDLQRVTTSPETGARLLSTAALIDVSDLVSQVRAPTLVLHATGDAVASFSQGRKLAALIPGARFVPLESRNHILLEHEPAWTRFVDEVRRFLADANDSAPQRTATDAALRTGASSPQTRSARRPRGRSG